MNNKERLRVLVNPRTKKLKPKIINQTAPYEKSGYNLVSASLTQNDKFAEILDVKTIFKDKELKERKCTFNAFLKSNDGALHSNEAKSTQSKQFFFNMKKHINYDTYLVLKKMHQKSFQSQTRKGIIKTNELWSEKDYKKLISDSGLKPKIDYSNVNKKIKIFNEIVSEISSAFTKPNAGHFGVEKKIIKSVYEQNFKKGKEENSLSDQVITRNLDEKIKEYASLHSFDKGPEKIKALIESKISDCNTESQKNLEEMRTFRNRLLQNLQEKKHKRDSILKKTLTFHRKESKLKTETDPSLSSERKFSSFYIRNQKSVGLINHKNYKVRNMELIKKCDEEKNSNRIVKK